MNLTVSQVTVTDGLLTSMKINCDIYCHRAPPLLITNPTVSVNNLRWEVPVSSHQRKKDTHVSDSSNTVAAVQLRRPRLRLDNRYIAPLFITFILLVGHILYGI